LYVAGDVCDFEGWAGVSGSILRAVFAAYTKVAGDRGLKWHNTTRLECSHRLIHCHK
jgi:hypothetical protein